MTNPVLLSFFAQSDEYREEILNNLKEQGWTPANPKVAGSQLNTLFFQIFAALNFQKEYGFSYYDENDTHKVGHFKRHLNKIYFCKKDNDSLNKQTPVDNTEYWVMFIDLDNPPALGNHNHDTTYAKLAGKNTQAFKVKDAENDDEAVSKKQMETAFENLDISPFTGFKNHLINGDMQVSQRADIDTAPVVNNGAVYAIDRFRGASSTTQTIQRISTNQPSHAVGGKSLKFVATTTINGSIGAVQDVEHFEKFKGQEVTLSTWVKSNNANARLMIVAGADAYVSNAHTGDETWQLLQVTVTLKTTITNLICYFRIMDSQGNSQAPLVANVDYIEFTQAQLELGNKATSFEIRPLSLELCMCQRYFTKGFKDVILSARTTDTGKGVANIFFPVKMRVIPTCNIISTGNVSTHINTYPHEEFVGYQATVSGGTATVKLESADAEIY